jgi:ethanolaminephosphotransferase
LSSKTPVELFLIIGTVGHTLSLLSSSFVEEEHQTWYFYMQTINLVILLKYSAEAAQVYFKPRRKPGDVSLEEMSKVISGSRSSEQERRRRFRSSSSSDFSCVGSGEYLSDSKGEPGDCLKFVVLSIVGACLCRILRSWNQTGDKWAHLPDIGDWLIR